MPAVTRRHPPLRFLCAGVLAAALGAMPLAAGEAPPVPIAADQVPVQKVVLFSSGVGYFEHAGKVAGNTTSELRFKTAQINDVLKSLIVEDRDGGSIRTIAYPSQDPIAKILKSFQVDIAANPTLGDLLNQLRGARVAVTVQNERLSGTILGLEKQKRAIGPDKREAVEVWLLNLIAGASIRTVALEDVRQLDLEDPQLQAELAKALAALAQSRDQDKKPVAIDFQGQGERRVRIGYVVETPVWKTSYRLMLPDDIAAKPRLQGWAIIENQTDNDWTNVTLTLVSGRPISFIQDLYQPLYIPRPVVQPELYAGLRPQTYDDGRKERALAVQEFGRERGVALQRKAEGKAGAPAAPAPLAAAAMADMAAERLEPAMDANQGVAAIADAEKVGEFFQYTVPAVSLPRQRSAMIPIVTDEISVERLSIYNQQVLAKNPLHGARLVNTTGKHLLQGPVTVLDAGSYAGDARIDNLPPGQERLLSFAIDLEMAVEAAGRRQDSALLTGRLLSGVLELRHKLVTTQEYLARNKSERDRTLVIEHHLQPGWKLVDSPKPMETTEALYRFKDTLKAGQESKLVVKEEMIQHESIALLHADFGQLEFYSRAGEIPPTVREALLKAMVQKRAMEDTQRQMQERQQKVQEITNEQNRLRENMKTVASNSQYYNRLLAKLNDQETAMEKLQGEIETLRKSHEQQFKALEEYLAGMNVE